MEKLFRPNKIFVVFCLLLIFVWLGLQYVSNIRITEAATAEAQEVFDWSWPGQVSSKAEITNVSVLNRSDNEAKVRVKAKQTLTKLADSPGALDKDGSSKAAIDGPSTSDTACVLTLYRSDRNWVLGKVEFD
ncbi:MAG: hypothetical protein IT343_05910 [Candidatus Melainabacteria bacterium]|jgi:hypothetical protein|nr:hypothetical protein [Candidatus Melainabacteria bacterium]